MNRTLAIVALLLVSMAVLAPLIVNADAPSFVQEGTAITVQSAGGNAVLKYTGHIKVNASDTIYVNWTGGEHERLDLVWRLYQHSLRLTELVELSLAQLYCWYLQFLLLLCPECRISITIVANKRLSRSPDHRDIPDDDLHMGRTIATDLPGQRDTAPGAGR